jgi:Ala-tRNA(Pro) deacylase
MKAEAFLKEHGVRFQTHEHAVVYTAQEVAAQEHVSGHALAKSVLVRADDRFVLCVLPASRKLDLNKVGHALGAKRVSLADEQEMAERFPDIEVGAESPLGSIYSLPTLVDEHLARVREITFQADTHRQVIRMTYADYAALCKPMVADLSFGPG